MSASGGRPADIGAGRLAEAEACGGDAARGLAGGGVLGWLVPQATTRRPARRATADRGFTFDNKGLLVVMDS
jgi:hypothetical protein